MMNKKFLQQWSKIMYSFFDYLPCKYEATRQEWRTRKFIWDFKDGKNPLSVAEMVARQIRKQFGAQCDKICFACIPAHSAEANETRYKTFSAEVCRLTGAANAYDAIHVSGSRLAIHEHNTQKDVRKVEVIDFDQDFFKGKKVLVFDDILTRGYSYANFACELERFGAQVLGGFFLGRTLLK